MEKPMNDHELFAAMTENKHKEKCEEKKNRSSVHNTERQTSYK